MIRSVLGKDFEVSEGWDEEPSVSVLCFLATVVQGNYCLGQQREPGDLLRDLNFNSKPEYDTDRSMFLLLLSIDFVDRNDLVRPEQWHPERTQEHFSLSVSTADFDLELIIIGQQRYSDKTIRHIHHYKTKEDRWVTYWLGFSSWMSQTLKNSNTQQIHEWRPEEGGIGKVAAGVWLWWGHRQRIGGWTLQWDWPRERRGGVQQTQEVQANNFNIRWEAVRPGTGDKWRH